MACLPINSLLNTFDCVAVFDLDPAIISPTFYATNQLLNLYLPFQPSHQNSSSIHCKRYCRHPNQHNQTKKSNPPSINTMGWKQGIGRELLYQLIQSIQPTTIFSFSEDESSNPIHSNDLEISKTQPIGPTPLSSGQVGNLW
ncbi:hypothetical protein O181_062754 [Austropuccinia psidii MF-1]|uniref:Polynucleotide 5'-hydroxyl-kinase GRC3 n=1 Tax=Austropuccinia psidii MF-1 TaxID=1389203 RepID=A0A9Q3EL08_9BASI|nr:hypothetical protein [Austropuccinia psidii MF-1]